MTKSVKRWGSQLREIDQDAGRDRILEAARRCYGSKGITATTFEDIAKAAKISRRTIYNYFENKQAIIQAIVDEQALEFLAQAIDDLGNDTENFFDRLESTILYLVINGPLAPGHQLLLGGQRSLEIHKYYLSSHILNGEYWSQLIEQPFRQAQEEGMIAEDIRFSEMSTWIGRIVFSYIQFPVDEQLMRRDIQHFFIAALRV